MLMRYIFGLIVKKIFVDVSAWIAHLLLKETHHKEISNYFADEIKSDNKFFTSDYVLDESYTRLLTNQGFIEAKKFRNYINKAEKQNNLLVLFTDEVLFNKSWVYFEKFSEHKLSFTDVTIYAFVKDLKIDEILSINQGFKKVGLKVKPRLRW